MHEARRIRAAFTCCDPLRQICLCGEPNTAHDHARARARVTGYRQVVFWSIAYREWAVKGTAVRIKPWTWGFDTTVQKRIDTHS